MAIARAHVSSLVAGVISKPSKTEEKRLTQTATPPTTVTKTVLSLLLLGVLCLSLQSAEGRASTANETAPSTGADKEAAEADEPLSEDPDAEADLEDDEELDAEGEQQVQYPFRDLPADVLRDFPGLCFGSTALRLFQVGQSWSLTPFCGVATCLPGQDQYGTRYIERVQDCGPQPKRNPKCKNVNARSQAQFPLCCPQFECEEGVELEYPTQEELQQLAHEAAQAAVRAQYEDLEEEDQLRLTGRKNPSEDLEEGDEPAVAEPVKVEPTAKDSETADEIAAEDA